MKQTETQNWLDNLENAVRGATIAKGIADVKAVLRRYDASILDDLASCYYPDVFSELEAMAADDKSPVKTTSFYQL